VVRQQARDKALQVTTWDASIPSFRLLSLNRKVVGIAQTSNVSVPFGMGTAKNEWVGFHPTFSRHAKAETSFALVIWLNENVPIVEFSLA
jgi:hypothetical protein